MKKFTRHSFKKVGFVCAQMVFIKTLLTNLLIILPILLFSQEKIVEKANLAYKYKQYAEAANLYEQAIAEKGEKKSGSSATLNLKTKLAYC